MLDNVFTEGIGGHKRQDAHVSSNPYAGPYASVAQANENIPYGVRKKGLKCIIYNAQNLPVQYWYYAGTEDTDLIPIALSGQTISYIESGTIYRTAPYTYANTAFSWYIDNVNYTVAAGTTVLTDGSAMDEGESRIDVFYVADSAAIQVVQGDSAVDPIKPAIPQGALEVTFVIVSAAGENISNTLVYDEAAGYPLEFNFSSTNGVIANNADDSFNGARSILVNSFDGAIKSFSLAAAEAQPLNFNTLQFQIKFVQQPSSLTSGFFIKLIATGTDISSFNLWVQNGDFGIDFTNTNDYQLIAIPFSLFAFTQSTIDSFHTIHFQFPINYHCSLDVIELISNDDQTEVPQEPEPPYLYQYDIVAPETLAFGGVPQDEFYEVVSRYGLWKWWNEVSQNIGGGISISDGSVTVPTAVGVLFESAGFSVIDNGNGTALVKNRQFTPGVPAPNDAELYKIYMDSTGQAYYKDGNLLLPFASVDIQDENEISQFYGNVIRFEGFDIDEVEKKIKNTTLIQGSYFVNTTGGNDTTGQYQNPSRPFKTLDAAITAYKSNSLANRIVIQDNNAYTIDQDFNGISIEFYSDFACSISFVNTSGSTRNLNNTTGTWYWMFNIQKGTLNFNNSTTIQSAPASQYSPNVYINAAVVNWDGYFSFNWLDYFDFNVAQFNTTGTGSSYFIGRNKSINSSNLKISNLLSANRCKLISGPAATLTVDIDYMESDHIVDFIPGALNNTLGGYYKQLIKVGYINSSSAFPEIFVQGNVDLSFKYNNPFLNVKHRFNFTVGVLIEFNLKDSVIDFGTQNVVYGYDDKAADKVNFQRCYLKCGLFANYKHFGTITLLDTKVITTSALTEGWNTTSGTIPAEPNPNPLFSFKGYNLIIAKTDGDTIISETYPGTEIPDSSVYIEGTLDTNGVIDGTSITTNRAYTTLNSL